MRILLVGPSLFMPWTAYTARALTRLGQSVDLFYYSDILVDRCTLRKGRSLAAQVPRLTGWIDRWRSGWQEARDRRLLKRMGSFRPDLVLVLRGESFSPNFLTTFKRQAHSPVVTWWLDDPFRYGIQNLMPLYDLFFIFDRSYISRLTQAGAPKVRFLPCACDETVYHPRTLTRREKDHYRCDVALVGWYYEERAELVRRLAGLDLKIWGRGWTTREARGRLNGVPGRMVQNERFIRDEVVAKIYSVTKIGLNIHSDQTREAGLNSRTFELLATGAFELMDAVPGMEELLEPGREVIVYRSPEEARSLVEFHLRHPEKRASIAARGQARALRDHTYLHRMKGLLQAVQKIG